MFKELRDSYFSYESLKRYRIVPHGANQWAIEVYCKVVTTNIYRKYFCITEIETVETFTWVGATWYNADNGKGPAHDISPCHCFSQISAKDTMDELKKVIDSTIAFDAKIEHDVRETERRLREIVPLEYP